MKHTSLPWGALNNGRSTLWHVEGPDGAAVCSVPKARKADAAYIVRACNSHYELLAALESLLELHRPTSAKTVYQADKDAAILQASAAIAKAKAKG